MGNSFQKNDNNIDGCLKFDRILDGENEIYIGLGSMSQGISTQVIRIGDFNNKYNKLLEFSEEKNKLNYKFENNIIMNIEKENENMRLEITDPKNKRNISKNIDPIIIKYFKPIKMSNTSNEFDKIYDLFQSSNITSNEVNPDI